MSHLPIWYTEQIPTAICDAVVAELSILPKKDAGMGIDGSVNNHSQRNTDVRFAMESYWFANFMLGVGHKANKTCKWGFDLNGNENIQYAEYNPGQHYDWHMDGVLAQ
jgi:hypothetical protein